MTREKDVQRDVVNLFRGAGCIVYNLSQPRATMQTPGLSDLLVFCLRKRAFWFFEVKTPEGKQSEDQENFEKRCETADVTYACGGVDAAEDQLKAIGVL